MDPRSPNVIDFQWDTKNDILIAWPRWNIRTDADCALWYKQWVDHLQKLGRKVDCIMVLDDFKVDAKIGPKWGEFRARINNELIRHSFRVNSSWAVRIFVLTSGTRYNAESNEAATIEDAVQGLLDLRRGAEGR